MIDNMLWLVFLNLAALVGAFWLGWGVAHLEHKHADRKRKPPLA